MDRFCFYRTWVLIVKKPTAIRNNLILVFDVIKVNIGISLCAKKPFGYTSIVDTK